MRQRVGKCVQHHTKYKELHGVDEIVLMTTSEHRILHNKLRREGKCKIPTKELQKISHNARNRSEQGKLQHRISLRYIPDNLITKISNTKWDIQDFIKEAIEEKLEREKKETMT